MPRKKKRSWILVSSRIFCHTWQCLPSKILSIWLVIKLNLGTETYLPLKNPVSSSKKNKRKGPFGFLHCSCYTSSPLQAPGSLQTISKQAISYGRWVPPASENKVWSLVSCDNPRDSRTRLPHTHSSEYLGSLMGLPKEKKWASLNKSRRDLERSLYSQTSLGGGVGKWNHICSPYCKVNPFIYISWSFLLNSDLFRSRISIFVM